MAGSSSRSKSLLSYSPPQYDWNTVERDIKPQELEVGSYSPVKLLGNLKQIATKAFFAVMILDLHF